MKGNTHAITFSPQDDIRSQREVEAIRGAIDSQIFNVHERIHIDIENGVYDADDDDLRRKRLIELSEKKAELDSIAPFFLRALSEWIYVAERTRLLKARGL